jgi:histidinol dehydrogenase
VKRFDQKTLDALFKGLKQRKTRQGTGLFAEVSPLIEKVISGGDKALFELTARFDGVHLNQLRVDPIEMKQAYDRADRLYIDALEQAIVNIRKFHLPQVIQPYCLKEDGKQMGQRILPIERVGVYVPGGEASYPSTLLMNVIPAQIAGVNEIVIVTPPPKSSEKRDSILVAAHMLGIREMYLVGGVQAIAALAYGTETIEPVDKICGPGNKYVSTAKKIVFGDVAIDMIAGPSEILILSDGSKPISYIAADMIAQLEHDSEAMAILLTTSLTEWQSIQGEMDVQLSKLKNQGIVSEAYKDNAYAVLCDSVQNMIALSNRIAPEHLELMIENPEEILECISSAGAIFLGAYTPETLGDYMAGPNHTLPTTGNARFASPLGTYDFQKRINYLYYDKKALSEVRDLLIKFTEKEGLPGHGRAVEIRV